MDFGTDPCSPATLDLCRLLLLDSAHLQEADADYLNRHGLSRHQPALPLYTVADAQRAIAALRPVDFDTATDLPGGCGVQLTPAGHILGAAIVQIRHPGGRLVFSGDLGRYGDPLMPPPGGVAQADHLIVESTYGNRKHSAEQAADALEAVITRTVRRGGTVVIPAFAVGARRRCSYYIWQLKQAGRIARDLPVFLDSPMASGAVDVHLRHAGDQRSSAADARAAFGVATYVTEVEQSKALDSSPMPKIIVSASGMATGGRVIHHLKHYLPDPRSTVLFAGFQAEARAARRCWTAPPRSRSMAAMCPCAPRSTACRCCRRTRMPTRSCAGCAGSSARPGKPSSCMASRRRRRAAPAHQGRAGWRCRAVEQNDVAELADRRGRATSARPPRSIVPGSSARLGQRSLGARGVQGERRRTPACGAATSCPARKASRHRHSGATASPAPARAASSAVR